MKLYALRDEANEEAGTLALLECYTNPQAFYFELSPTAELWSLPFILFEHFEKGELTIGNYWSSAWVHSRIVPPERQNLGEILRVNGLDSYNELRLLELSEGRCAQDACYLTPIVEANLPSWYIERSTARIADAYALSDFRMAATFADGHSVLCDMQEHFSGMRELGRVLADESVFRRMLPEHGGHGVRWGGTLAVSAASIAAAGTELALSPADFSLVATQLLCDTSEAAELLGCTRQNISDLVKRGKLTPIKAEGRTQLFRRQDILARLD